MAAGASSGEESLDKHAKYAKGKSPSVTQLSHSDLGDLGEASAAWRETLLGKTQSSAFVAVGTDTSAGLFSTEHHQLRSAATCDQWLRDVQGSREVRFWV